MAVVLLTHSVFLFRSKRSHMEPKSMLGWLTTCSVVMMNTDPFSFLMILFCSSCMISALFHCILWSSFRECSAVLDSIFLPILCCVRVRWFWCCLNVSPIYLFPHSVPIMNHPVSQTFRQSLKECLPMWWSAGRFLSPHQSILWGKSWVSTLNMPRLSLPTPYTIHCT
jgi:hypothetical protein